MEGGKVLKIETLNAKAWKNHRRALGEGAASSDYLKALWGGSGQKAKSIIFKAATQMLPSINRLQEGLKFED
jgi:hypothetical protein